ncbi:putative esterase of the alpha-beta hydrolase superfamily, partial [Teratosphaeria nubilosa]
MEVLCGPRWHGTTGGGEDDWHSGRPQKKLRTLKSHASILQPVTKVVRSPLDSLGLLAEGLAYGSDGNRLSGHEQERQLELLRLQVATTCEEWQAAAEQLDEIEGGNEWKDRDESDEYDVELVRARLERLEKAKANHDLADMRFQVRTALTRDLGGMGNMKLYKHSRIGTKTLIEEYIDTVMETIDIVTASAGLDTRGVYEEMKLARQSFGRSALLLSGGGTLGMNHIGVVKALFDAGLLPRIISGASAGSIVCAVLCTKTDAELPEVLVEFCRGELDVFEKDGEPHSIFGRVTRFFTKGAIYDVDNLTRVMKNLLGNMTFMEAYNRTQRILNICVSSAGLYEMPRLLNYITAPHVMIWSAVAASCSVPGIFAAAQLEVKDPKTGATGQWTDDATKWIDGSVDNDLPMTRLAEIFNVNHFIVSQVNPHVVPFLDKHDELVPEAVPGLRPDHRWIHTMANLAKGEALHRMHVLAELGFFPTAMSKLRSVLGQRYAGDITIIPEMSYAQVPHILTNPTPEFMEQALSNGERATWPKLSRIRNHLAIELRLDSAVRSLLSRVAFSPSQADLR